MRELRFHGTGGHGIVVAAKLLALAAAKAGHHAQSFASYGALRRGGMVESYVRIDRGPISPHCKVYEADLTILMDDQFAERREIISGVKPESLVLVNSRASAGVFEMLAHASVTTVDAAGIARDNGLTLSSGLPIMNTVILGAVAALLGDISIDQLSEAIRDAHIPEPDKNVRAAREAYNSVAALKEPGPQEAPKPLGEPRPVYAEKRSPCEVNCPAGEPIRTYISLIQEGQTKKAVEAIRLENPFPGVCGRVCFRPCEAECNRKEFDQSVSINALERAAFDLAPGRAGTGEEEAARRERTGKRVAIIGAGPAGLSCAYFLTLLGHGTTVFEALPAPGGVPRAAIPSYRLPRGVIESEIARLIAMGVTINGNTTVGKEMPFEQVVGEHDACFVATGAHASMKLGIPGEDGRGVVSGLDFLRAERFDRAQSMNRERVAVIGGGNTAVDAARTARRLGAKEVTIVYRRSIEEMPAYKEEREAAEKEGITILPNAAPVCIHSNGKKVKRVECQKTEPVAAPQGVRRAPRLMEGTNFFVDATVVIVAAGETPELSFLPASVGMEGPVIKTDFFGRTSVPGLFAGGDAASLSRSVAAAIGSGKRAAIGIDLFLKGEDKEPCLSPLVSLPTALPNLSMEKYLAAGQINGETPVASFDDLNPAYFLESPRRRRRELPVPERLRTFAEVRSGLSGEEAVEEATRCFQCGRCTFCENCYIFCSDVAVSFGSVLRAPIIAGSLCEGCGVCIHECPRGALSWGREERG